MSDKALKAPSFSRLASQSRRLRSRTLLLAAPFFLFSDSPTSRSRIEFLGMFIAMQVARVAGSLKDIYRCIVSVGLIHDRAAASSCVTLATLGMGPRGSTR